MTETRPVALTADARRVCVYLHVPFCAAKCGYCSFYSVPCGRYPDEVLVKAYLTALATEIERHREALGALAVETLYIGGGTPSLLPPRAWEKLLSLLEEIGDLSALREATVEANPTSLTEELLSLWRSSFLTRVSLGVQSLNDHELRLLGRLHDAKMASRSLDAVASSGLALSADLIFGIPGQTLKTWKISLSGVLNAGVSHLSTYQLTLESDAPLGLSSLALPDGYPFYRYAQWYLPLKGFLQYEISSFSPPGSESIHNLAYWTQKDVVALGPAAWGYLGGRRYSNAGTLEGYLRDAERKFPLLSQGGERLNARSQGIEAAILALRTRWGIRRGMFCAAWGTELLQEVENFLRESVPPRCVVFSEDSVALTTTGMRVGNAIWAGLLTLADAIEV